MLKIYFFYILEYKKYTFLGGIVEPCCYYASSFAEADENGYCSLLWRLSLRRDLPCTIDGFSVNRP